MRETRELTLFTSGIEDENHQCYANLHSSLSLKHHVHYSCGLCGYELNLNSGNRNTSVIGSKYEKVIKKGLISFWSIDETRFTRLENRRWFRRTTTTKLLCHRCGNHIGNARGQLPLPWNGISGCDNIYEFKIRALQPASASIDSSIFD